MLMEGIEENSSCFSLCVQACKDGSLEDLKDALSKCDNQKINPFKERSPRGSLFHIASMNRECPLEILEELITVFRKLSKKSSKKGSGLIAFLRDSLTPEEGYTALHCACKYNKLNYVYVFVKELRFYGIGHTAVSRHTPFEVCCQFKCQRVASFILQNCKGLYDDFSNGLVIAFGNGSVSHKEFIKEVCKVHKVTTQTLDSLCRKKLFNIVKFCIEEKLCKQEGKQLMQMAVSQGQTNLMKYHLHVDNYHEIYTVPDKSGNNLMHIACSEHQLDSIHCLIASGYAEMALAKNKNRETPFDIAVYKHFEDITLLFEKELKLTPLHLYCLRDPAISEDKEIIEVLKTIIASTVQDAYLNSALRYACQNAHLFIVNNLLLVFESEIDLSEPNSNGDTPVHLLVQQLCLISKKIKANEESNEALKKRSRKKRLQRQEEKIVFLLSVMMEHETFDPTILNAQNESAVFIFLTKLSYETFSYYDILRAFLKQAVTKYHKTNALSKDILNMVHHYCRYIYYVPKKGSGEYDINSGRFINFVQTLSSENNNFNPNEVDSEVFCKIYSLLMDKGASVDNIHLPIDTKEGNTLLHLACIAKSSFLLKSLTSRASIESMVNKQNKKGKAPIHLLCSNARKFVSVECFRILLNLPGIDVNLPNRSGNTPLSILTSHINSRRPIMYEGIKESILLLTEHSSFKPELYLTSDYLQIWCQVDKEDLFRQIFEIDKHRYLLNFVNYFSQNLLHIACLNFSSHKDYFENTPLASLCWRVFSPAKSFVSYQEDIWLAEKMIVVLLNVVIVNDNGIRNCLASVPFDSLLAEFKYKETTEPVLKDILTIANCTPVQSLLSKMLPEEVNDDGQTCLHVMIEEQNISYSSTPSKCFFEIFDLLKSKNLFHVEDVNGNTCLHLACNNKALSTLIREIVYANPRLVTIKNNEGNTPLHIACNSGQLEAIDILLQQKHINLRSVNAKQQTVFHISICKKKIIDLLKTHLSYQDNILCMRDADNCTCLHLAYEIHIPPCTILDMSLIADIVNIKNSKGQTMLHICPELILNTKITKLDVAAVDNDESLLPDYDQCSPNCHSEMWEQLMSNVNIQNKNGETPFHCLYKSSDDEATDKAALLFNKCWEILVNHVSFDPNIQDACGMTILHYECQKSKPDFVLVKRLLSLNATNTKLRNNQNQTCILVAEASSCKEKSYLLSLLKTHRSDNDFLAFSHLMSPYHGLYDFHKRCNCCLMLHAMSLNNEKCKDALYLACEAVCPESISKLLLRCRNKLICNYIKQQSGQTPLHSLALGLKKQADFIIQGYSDNLLKLRQKDLSFVRGKVNILSKHDWRILLQCGINKQDDLGNTALHYVCEAQNVTMLRVLTSDSSCRFDIRNNAEKLPITIAYESGNRSFYLRFLIKYFRSQGDEGFADYYKTVLKDGATISMTPVKCILTGPPGAGKTTLKQRLLGEKLASTISTGVSDSPQVIAVRNISHEQVSLPSSEMKWTPVDIRDQIEALLETVSLHAHNAIKETLGRPPVLPPSTRYGISKNAKSSKDTNYNDTGNSSKKFKSGFNEWHEKQGKGKPKKFKSIEKQLKELRILANSVPSKKSKSDQHKFTIRELEKNPFVRVIDTGGQPELHELLPAFVNGPAINLIVFDLQIPLQDQIPIYCRSEDEGDSVVYSSCINHEDMILRSLSSIACLGYGQQMNFNEDGVSHSSTYPAAFLIGSHKDMVKEEVIKLVNEHLMSLIKTCDLDVHEIIQRYENCLFYPINGLDESSKEIDKLRQEIFNATKQFKSVEVPMTWLILSIKLQVLYEKKEINCVIDIEKCFKIANIECGFKSIDEMKNALWFYHYVMGTIMYFPYIPELNEKVILDLQAIFDCVTKLINCCFVYGTVSERTEEEFTKFGTFFVRHLEKVLNSKDNKSKYPFSAREIIALLKHLHAIVAIDDDKYFMPTALKPVLLSEAHQDATSCPPPLLISFACGYTPVGIFGSLVTHLLSNAKHNIECKLADDTRQYRNKIVLSCGSYHADLILMAWSRFIEINFKRKGDLHESIADVCQKVRLAIDESIEVISKSFNYKCKAKHSFGFPCNNLACNSLPVHPAICKVAIRSAECVQKNNLIELSDSQLIWFGIQQEQVVENGLMEDSLSEEIFQKTLEIDDLDDVFEKLDDLNEWKKLGLKLGLKYPTLERIEKDKRVIDDCKMEMLACWLKKQDKVKSPSWKQLIIVLCKMKETEISKKIIEELRI
uniref:Death domain-containing protein n=2 Tax=Amphimedon queenslandica TaxID=400682 RepID=A0A1X7TPX7_AMPQE